MTLGTAVILLLLAAAGIVASCLWLRQKTLRVVLVVVLGLAALALIGYIGLTLLFVGAVSHQPPVG